VSLDFYAPQGWPVSLIDAGTFVVLRAPPRLRSPSRSGECVDVGAAHAANDMFLSGFLREK
jgi:hypothetical protein